MVKKNYGQITGFASPFLESKRMKKITSIVKGGDILDYGCGNGKLSEMLQYNSYTGVDLDYAIVCQAKIRYSGLKNVNFYTNEEFNFNLELYDYIILSAVIEHIEDPTKILIILKNRLRNRGKIVITTPTHVGNKLLEYGSKLGIFSSSAFKEHNHIFSRKDFIIFSKKLNLTLDIYETFECGFNQLTVFLNDK